MLFRSTDAPVPLAEYVPAADDRVLLHDVSWAGYQSLLAVRGEQRSPRIAYLDGVVELMSPSWNHDGIVRTIEHLLAVYLDEREIPWTALGSWTLKRRLKKAGVEPDGCFIFGPDPDPDRQKVPDLALEVVWTSGGIDKLAIYQRLGIREVWYWERDAITVYALTNNGYRKRRSSGFVPGIDFKLMCRLAPLLPSSKATAELRRILRGKR